MLPVRTHTDGGLRFAAGALDGVMTHHVAATGEDLRPRQLARALASALECVDADAVGRIQTLVVQAPIVRCADDIVEQLQRIPGLDVARLRSLAEALAMHARDPEVVKLAIVVLGCITAHSDLDRDILLTLGAHDEFTLYSAVALANTMQDAEQALFLLARRVRGWGRIQLVERLAETEASTIKDWMLREGFENTIMNEYLAFICATTGELASALAPDRIDDTLFAGTTRLLAALITGGPARDINDYDAGVAVVTRFLEHAQPRLGDDLELLLTLSTIRRFVGRAHSSADLQALGWTAEVCAELTATCAEFMAPAIWGDALASALEDTGSHTQWLATRASRILGIDIWDHLVARVEADWTRANEWHCLSERAEGERVDMLVELAQRCLPLDEIATGADQLHGLGREFVAHHCLDFLLQGLRAHPGKGWPLLACALESPVTRNRNGALNVLEVWAPSQWSDQERGAVEAAMLAEPNDELRNRMSTLLSKVG